MEQAYTQPQLELRQPTAQGRARHVELAGRAGQAARVNDRDELFESPQQRSPGWLYL